MCTYVSRHLSGSNLKVAVTTRLVSYKVGTKSRNLLWGFPRSPALLFVVLKEQKDLFRKSLHFSHVREVLIFLF